MKLDGKVAIVTGGAKAATQAREIAREIGRGERQP